jgi:hypothetical protein
VDPLAPLRRAWDWLLRSLDVLRTQSPELYRVLVGVLVAVLALILAHAVWVAYRTMRGDATREIGFAMAGPEVRGAAWYAGEADRLAKEGRFAEAVQADFIRLMLELDARQIVHFHPSRTPNEYARDPSLAPASQTDLTDLVRRLYAYAFGRARCGEDELREWQVRARVERYARA